jgi:hypothetical protein
LSLVDAAYGTQNKVRLVFAKGQLGRESHANRLPISGFIKLFASLSQYLRPIGSLGLHTAIANQETCDIFKCYPAARNMPLVQILEPLVSGADVGVRIWKRCFLANLSFDWF